jgi:hypothetical protein
MKERRREGGDSRGKEINKKERRDVIREKRKHRRERERRGEETCCYQYPGAACAGVRLDQTDPQ